MTDESYDGTDIVEAFLRHNVKRIRTRLSDQLKPCECCHYPVSQRHHPFAHSEHGELGATIQLCPNCHDLYHIVENAIIHKRETAREKFLALAPYPDLQPRILFCLHYIDFVHNTTFKQVYKQVFNKHSQE